MQELETIPKRSSFNLSISGNLSTTAVVTTNSIMPLTMGVMHMSVRILQSLMGLVVSVPAGLARGGDHTAIQYWIELPLLYSLLLCCADIYIQIHEHRQGAHTALLAE